MKNKNTHNLGGNRFRLLIIDEDKTQTKGIACALEHQFSDIAVTHNPMEAIHLAESNEYDVIIMEIKFSIMDGLVTTTQLKKLLPNAAIFVCSAHYNASVCLELGKMGIHRFIEKPIDVEYLKTEINLLILKNY